MLIEESAYAKLNLRLKVVGRREDGFHLLCMLNVLIPLKDDLSLAIAVEDSSRPGSRADLEVKFPDRSEDSLSAGLLQDNLIMRAASQFFRLYPQKTRAEFVLQKRIPMQAGLGGGSSDAAAALRLLSRAYGVPLESLSKLALQIGADVPFFLASHPFAFVGGIGEEIVALPPELLNGLAALIVKPKFGISTAAVFEQLRKTHAHEFSEDQECREFVESVTKQHQDASSYSPLIADLQAQLLRLIGNDLQPVAAETFPGMAELLNKLESYGSFRVSMSGSGSTIFAIFNAADRLATDAAIKLCNDFKEQGMFTDVMQFRGRQHELL